MAVIEVGVGGRTDATNVIEEPIVTAVTSLGYDHMDVLGDTLADIAFEKSGIFKVNFRVTAFIFVLITCMQKGVPTFTISQPVEAMEVLQKRSLALAQVCFCCMQVVNVRENYWYFFRFLSL